MINRATIFWLVALTGMALVTVTVSLQVNRVNRQIDAIEERRASVAERTALLEASYQLLVSPERLRPLADRHLDLEEVHGDQLIALEELPQRMPLPLARNPEDRPEIHGQRELPPAADAPAHNPPGHAPAPPGLRQTLPWLEAQGDSALQPVNLSTPQGRPQ